MEFHDDLADLEVIAQRLTCQEPYCGEWDSEKDFARHIVEECYNIEKMMGSFANYFNYDAYARELFMYDFSMGANNLQLTDRMGGNNVFIRV